jgi:hypothetical protein
MRHLEDPTLLDTVLRARAERLGVSIEDLLAQAKEHPTTLDLYVERGVATSQSPLDLLRAELDPQRRQSTYPGPECLLPHELQALAAESLAEDRLLHVQSCAPCRSLLDRLRPNAERLAAFTREVHEHHPEFALAGERASPKAHGAH